MTGGGACPTWVVGLYWVNTNRVWLAGEDEMTRQWAAMLAGPTAIAGIRGTNSNHMAELTTPHSCFIVPAAITTDCGFLFQCFERAGVVRLILGRIRLRVGRTETVANTRLCNQIFGVRGFCFDLSSELPDIDP